LRRQLLFKWNIWGRLLPFANSFYVHWRPPPVLHPRQGGCSSELFNGELPLLSLGRLSVMLGHDVVDEKSGSSELMDTKNGCYKE